MPLKKICVVRKKNAKLPNVERKNVGLRFLRKREVASRNCLIASELKFCRNWKGK